MCSQISSESRINICMCFACNSHVWQLHANLLASICIKNMQSQESRLHTNPNNTITALGHLVYSRVEEQDERIQVKTYVPCCSQSTIKFLRDSHESSTTLTSKQTNRQTCQTDSNFKKPLARQTCATYIYILVIYRLYMII